VAQQSYLWTTSSSGDGSSTYTRSDWTEIAKILGGVSGCQGIVPQCLSCFSAASENTTVIVGTGAALVDGKPYRNTASASVTIPATAASTRIDRVTIRAMWNAGDASPQTVRLYRIEGTESGTPSAPSLVQISGSTYDLPLYQVTIDSTGSILTLTDERYFSSCALSGCGIQVSSCGGNLEVSDGAISSCKIGATSIYNSKIVASAVTTTKIMDGTIMEPQVADWSLSASKMKYGVVAASVRQGGDTDNWGTSGSTNYTLTSILPRIQCGVGSYQICGGSVTFPEPFGYTPIVLITACDTAAACGVPVYLLNDILTTGFSFGILRSDTGVPLNSGSFMWMAIGSIGGVLSPGGGTG